MDPVLNTNVPLPPQPGFRPQPLGADTQTPILNQAQPPQELKVDGSLKSKIILFFVVVAFLLLVAGTGGGFYLYKTNFFAKSEVNSTNQVQNGEKSTEEIISGNITTPIPTVTSTPKSIVSEKEIDPSSPTYVNQANGFSFEKPVGWVKDENSGVVVSYICPTIEMTNNNLEFHAVLDVTIEDNLGNISLVEYAKSGNAKRALSFTNYELGSSKPSKLGGDSAFVDDFEATVGSVRIKERQIYAIHSGKAYVLTFLTTPETWIKYENNFNKVEKSFNFSGIVSGIKTGF